jgi:hypothetical protein
MASKLHGPGLSHQGAGKRLHLVCCICAGASCCTGRPAAARRWRCARWRAPAARMQSARWRCLRARPPTALASSTAMLSARCACFSRRQGYCPDQLVSLLICANLAYLESNVAVRGRQAGVCSSACRCWISMQQFSAACQKMCCSETQRYLQRSEGCLAAAPGQQAGAGDHIPGRAGCTGAGTQHPRGRRRPGGVLHPYHLIPQQKRICCAFAQVNITLHPGCRRRRGFYVLRLTLRLPFRHRPLDPATCVDRRTCAHADLCVGGVDAAGADGRPGGPRRCGRHRRHQQALLLHDLSCRLMREGPAEHNI